MVVIDTGVKGSTRQAVEDVHKTLWDPSVHVTCKNISVS